MEKTKNRGNLENLNKLNQLKHDGNFEGYMNYFNEMSNSEIESMKNYGRLLVKACEETEEKRRTRKEGSVQ